MLRQAKKTQRKIYVSVLLTGCILLLIGFVLNLSIGASSISLATVFKALLFNKHTEEMLIVQQIRLPRAIIALIIGASLAVAGTIMQTLTRNPLANPQIFGVNAGASLVVVAATVFWPQLTQHQLVYFAFIGALIGGLIVYVISIEGNLHPARLAVVGMTVHLFLSSITQGLILFHEHTTDSVLYWLVGAIANRNWGHIEVIFPWFIGSMLIAFVLMKSLTVLNMGEDLARGLGVRIGLTRLIGGLLVMILAGSSVSVAGPIGFVGLLVPHIVRSLVGVDLCTVLPCAAIYGSVLLLYTDIAARYIAFPYEAPIGMVTALIGTPFFLCIAWKGGNRSA